MELYQAEVCIGGLLTNTVVKEEVTASEILILQQIHGGSDAVRKIKPLGNKQREYQKEYDRLVRVYGPRRVQLVFPGARPVLPQKLADVGIIVTEVGDTTTEIVARGPNNKNVKTAKQKQLEALGVEDEARAGGEEDGEE